MMTVNMQGIVEAVLARAQRQGSVTPEDVQEELTNAGVPEEMWEEALGQCRRSRADSRRAGGGGRRCVAPSAASSVATGPSSMWSGAVRTAWTSFSPSAC